MFQTVVFKEITLTPAQFVFLQYVGQNNVDCICLSQHRDKRWAAQDLRRNALRSSGIVRYFCQILDQIWTMSKTSMAGPPWSRVLLEKLNRFQLVKKFPPFYGTRRFITAFASALHLSLSRASSIQSIPPHPTSCRSILILSSHLRLVLPSGLFPSGFPTKTLYTPPLPISFSILSPEQYLVRSTVPRDISVEGKKTSL